MYLSTLKNHPCVKLRNIFLMRIYHFEKGEQRFGLHLSKMSRIGFGGSVSKVRYFHGSLHKGVTTSQLPLFLSLPLYCKIKVQYLKD